MASGGRRRGTVLIFVALILILLVVLVYAVTNIYNPFAPAKPVTQQPNNPQVQATPVIEMEKIVISIQPIKRGKEITSDVITTIDIPRSAMVGGAFITKPEDVIGKRAKIDIEARVPFNPNLLVDPSVKNSPAAFQIPRGQVAISIPVSNLSSVSYGLQAGDHVNVITTLLLVDLDTEFQSKLPNLTGVVTAPGTVPDGPTTLSSSIAKSDSPTGRTELDKTLGQPIYLLPSESPRPRLVSQTLIQDAVVLQVGVFPQSSGATTPAGTANQPAAQPTAVAAGQQQAPAEKVNLPNTITLVVTPQDAVTLNYLIVAGGRLNLVMRAAGDDQRIATEAVTLQFVLDQYNIPSPAKLPYGLEPRLDAFPTDLAPFPPSQPNTDQTVVTPVP
jgi:Flp pilus assembly protein CpaB